MKRKILYAVASTAFIAIMQLLFFWLVSASAKTFWSIYPFYTALTVAHTALFYYICGRYKYPASFPFALTGSIIVVVQAVSSILMGIFDVQVRTALFIEAIIIAVYILLSALLIGIASKESITSDEPVEVVIQYPVRPMRTASESRMPSAVDTEQHS